MAQEEARALAKAEEATRRSAAGAVSMATVDSAMLERMVELGNLDGVKRVANMSPKLLMVQNSRGDPSLHMACACGQEEVAEFIVKETKFLINHPNKKGQTALMRAAACSKPDACDIVSMLIRAGADTEQRDVKGWSAMMHAVEAGSFECVKSLLDGAELDNGGDVPGKVNADPNNGDVDGVTPLGRAFLKVGGKTCAADARAEIMTALLAKDAAAGWDALENIPGCSGPELVRRAAEYFLTDSLSALIKAGGDASGADEDGWTPMLKCMGSGQTETALQKKLDTLILLKQSGAEIEGQTAAGQSMEDLAKMTGAEDAYAYLLKMKMK